MNAINIKEKILEFNKSFETLAERLIRIKKEKTNLTDKQSFNAMMDSVEEFAEKPIVEKKRSFADILAERKAKKAISEFSEQNLVADTFLSEVPIDSFAKTIATDETIEAKKTNETFSLSIVLNEKQLAAKEMAYAGKSFCLIGAAGTGKTTAQRSIAESLLEDSRLKTSSYKAYDADGNRKYVTAPSIAFVAYTRRAAANLGRAILKSPALAAQLSSNIMTIHALLEYEPETYFDADEQKEKFRFSPRRNAANPLTITHLVIEEASMLGVADLWPRLYEALPPGVQIIFIGDINQLPPVFGPSILNYALVQLPIIELTYVYRNQGIVLENAHKILAGKEIVEAPDYTIVRGTKPVQEGQIRMSEKMAYFFEHMYDTLDDNGNRSYDPADCIILSPFNKQNLGTINMNKWIAQFLGAKREAVVHEVIAGFSKQYLAEGDKVMFNKIDGIITSIERNPRYFGKEPQTCGTHLSRFGHRILSSVNSKKGEKGKKQTEEEMEKEESINYANFSLEALEEEKLERKQQASHIITITYEDGRYDTLSTAGDLAEAMFSLGYCLTVHKAQGSEWRKVFIIFHRDHSIMLFRELFYTAATRAKQEVCIIAKDAIINKAIKQQRIKGSTLKDKIEFFNSGQLKYSDIVCVKD